DRAAGVERDMLVDLLPLVRLADRKRAARREERMAGEARWWRREERQAGPIEGAHSRAAEVAGVGRGRAARACGRGRRICLEHDQLAVRRKLIGRRRAGDAGADDDEVS